jgi:hypothetical protein
LGARFLLGGETVSWHQAKLILALVLGIVIGIGAAWALGLGGGCDVTTVEGYTTAVNEAGTAIGLAPEPGDAGRSYYIAGAFWREEGGAWHTGGATCAEPLSSEQRVRIGVITVPPQGEAPGREVVVWLECLD